MENFATQTYLTGSLSALQMVPTEEARETSIYRSLIYYSSLTPIKKYDYIITTTIKALLEGKHMSKTHEFTVRDVCVEFPTYSSKIGDTSTKLLTTPYLACALGQNYMCKVYCIIDKAKIDENTISSSTRVLLGTIPSMVGSSRCLTGIKPDDVETLEEWKLTLGEGIQPGYFIRNGVKVALLSIVKQSTHTIFTTKIKQKIIVTRMTELYKGKTTVIRIKDGKHSSAVKILCPHIGSSKHYPLFIVYFVLFLKNRKEFNVDKLEKLICSYATKTERPFISSYLRTSIDKFNRFCKKEGKPDNEQIFEYIKNKIQKHKDQDKKTFSEEGIYQTIFDEISPSEKRISNKVANFSLMVCRHIRSCIGLRPFDNPDHGDKKKLDDFSRLLEQHINNVLKPRIMTREPDKGKWTIGKRDTSENVVEALKVESYSLIRSTYDKVNVDADDRNKSFELRRVQPTCFGGQCPVNTSEGKRCGMTGNICICTRISWNSEYITTVLPCIYTLKWLKRYIIFKKEEGYFPIKYVFEGKTKGMVFRSKGKDENNLTAYCNIEFVEFLRSIAKKKEVDRDLNIELKNDGIVAITFEESAEETFFTAYNDYKCPIKASADVVYVLKYCFAFINELCSSVKTKDYDYSFTYNSTVMTLEDEDDDTRKCFPTVLWFNPVKTMNKVKTYIRSGKLPIDTTVFINEIDKEVKFFFDSGRMMFPALITDDNGDLLMDTIDDGNYLKKNWNSKAPIDYSKVTPKIEKMFSLGLMEYVDMKALGTTFQAETVTECRRFSKLRYLLNNLDLNNSDSSFYENDGWFYIEDMSYVKIDKTKKDLKFRFQKEPEIENHLSTEVTVDGNPYTVYGYYSAKRIKYIPTKKIIYTLTKSDTTTIRDSLHLAYVNNEEVIVWIEDNISMDQTEYNGRQIIGINFGKKTEKNVILREIDGKYFISETTCTHLENTGSNYFLKTNNGIVWYDDYITEDGQICDEVDFNGKEEGFFEQQQGEYTFPVSTGMKYEKFDLENEKELFDDLVKTNVPNDRECDYLMTFRRNQQHLDEIDMSKIDEKGYLSSVFDLLRTAYPQFKKKSNVYKIHRYLNWRFKFTHCPIDPGIMYSAVANLSIKANHDQGPRFTYQCQMTKQALSLTNPMYFAAYETGLKRGLESEQHIVESVAEEPLYGVTMASTNNYIVATATDKDNFEDALTVARSVAYRYEKPFTLTYTEKDSGKGMDYVSFPKDNFGNDKINHKSRNLGKDGLPIKGSLMERGDYVCGLMRYNKITKESRDVSPELDFGDDAEVIQIRVFCPDNSTNKTIEIKLARRSASGLGDKFAAIHSQKGTLGKIKMEKNTKGAGLSLPGVYGATGDFSFLADIIGDDLVKAVADGTLKYKIVDDDCMPTVCGGPNNGMKIQILFSPFSYPSRMTMGMNYEKMGGKAGLRLQRKMNGSNFHKNEMQLFEQVLITHGLDKQGCEFIKHADGELVMDKTTGAPARIYICPCGYKKLRHDVDDKISIRYRHKRDAIIDQPNQGRKDEGGQRMGEMEKDVFQSYQAACLALDRLLYASDIHKVIFCTSCGKVSSNSDVLKRTCKICKMPDSLVVMVQTRISRVCFQYLSAVGICVKMIAKKVKEAPKPIKIMEEIEEEGIEEYDA